MEPEGSLQFTQKPATGPYPEPQLRLIDPFYPKVHPDTILPPMLRSSQWSLPSGPPNQNPVNTSPLPSRVPHVPATSSYFIYSPEQY
jgi:hypothetical protein